MRPLRRARMAATLLKPSATVTFTRRLRRGAAAAAAAADPLPPPPEGLGPAIGRALQEAQARLHKGPNEGDWVGIRELNVGDVVLVFEHAGCEEYSAELEVVCEINHPVVVYESGNTDRDDFLGVLLKKGAA